MYKPNSNCYFNKLCAVCVACNFNGLMAWQHTSTAVTSRQMMHFASSSNTETETGATPHFSDL